jgi:hypothetical protein
MTDEEIVTTIMKILKRQRAGEFGFVANMKPPIYVHMSPFAVIIGAVYLSRKKAIAVADGLLRVEPRSLGWALAGRLPKEPAPVRHESKAQVRARLDSGRRRKTTPHQHWTDRRKEYLKGKTA